MAVSVLQLPSTTSMYSYSMPLALTMAGGPATELRKRTTSFSSPPTDSTRPRKRLHRTESVVDLTVLARTTLPPYATPLTTPSPIPYNRTLKFYKEQKDRKKGIIRREIHPSPRSCASITPPVHPSANPILDRPLRLPSTSPLAQNDGCARAMVLPIPPSSFLACGPAHPPPPSARSRSKPKAQADLHRRALTACMRESPEGAKILRMGARLAVEIMSATKELERLCGNSENDLLGDEDAMGEIDDEVVAAMDDIDMEDVVRELTPEPEPVMSASWVVVGGQPLPCGREIAPQREDWEMVVVDCVA
ncbi:hypothetical protein MIND_00216000 [Mycena indigotica]|uniref:Uncharacterized protein n=1 Tax=Mycena indigotica TaxID=2126181 RepID=A0A8H6WH18_9AGAR|nr:uncharacterized protein MIND_00216000 [Mycena indigotica]KAF7312039.1 hypothetical protein MIND_00216000 [Mycena indigotica]